MNLKIKAGSTDQSIFLYIVDSTDGTPETGVLFNTAGIDLKYRRDGAAVSSITEATLASLTAAHSDGGFLEIGNGLYRLDLPDAALSSGVEKVAVFGTVTGMIVYPVVIELVAYDPYDTVRLGLTSLPNAAADAAGGLAISDAGGLDLDAIKTDTAAILVDTADMQPKIGTPAGASISADIATVDTAVDAIQADLDNGTDGLGAIKADTAEIGTAGAGLTDLGGMSSGMQAQVNAEVDTALNTAIPGSPTTDSINERIKTMDDGIIKGTAQTGTLSTTQATTDLSGYAADQMIGRIMTVLNGPAEGESSDITDYEPTGGLLTFTSMTIAMNDGNEFKIT